MSVHRALIFTSISRAHLIKHSILRLLNHDSSALFVALHDPFNSNNTGEIVGRIGFSGGENKFGDRFKIEFGDRFEIKFLMASANSTVLWLNWCSRRGTDS